MGLDAKESIGFSQVWFSPFGIILFAAILALSNFFFWPSLAFAQKKKAQLEGKAPSVTHTASPKSRPTAVKPDPNNSLRVYGATAEGLEVSDNGGLSWRSVPVRGTHEEVLALAVHPTRPDNLFVGRQDGLWLSPDNGKSWKRLPHPGDVPLSLAISRSRPDIFYLATSRQGLYKSTDSGNMWTEVYKGLPEARGGGRTEEIHTLSVHPSDSNVVYAAFARYGVYRTVNGGESWQEFNPGLPVAQPVLPPRLAFDPDDPRRVYLAFNERIHSHLIKPRLYFLAEEQKWLPVPLKSPGNLMILGLSVDRARQSLQLWGEDSLWQVPLAAIRPLNQK